MIQNSVHIGNRNAVVRHRNTGLLRPRNTRKNMGTVEHTAAALNDEIIGRKILGKIRSRAYIDPDPLPSPFP